MSKTPIVRSIAIGLTAFVVLATSACGDDDAATGGSSSGTTSTTATYCQAVPDGDSFCSCAVAPAPPKDAIDTCNTEGSQNTACCSGAGTCSCKSIACSESSDGSCTCRTGEPSSEKAVESCDPPDAGHCCKSGSNYCSCSASTCTAGDEEVDSCTPADMAKSACAAGEKLVDDCKTAVK